MKKKIIISFTSGIIFSFFFYLYSDQYYQHKYLFQGEINYLPKSLERVNYNSNLLFTYADKSIEDYMLQSHDNKYYEIIRDSYSSIFFYKLFKNKKKEELDFNKKKEEVEKLKTHLSEVTKILNKNLEKQYNYEKENLKEKISFFCEKEYLNNSTCINYIEDLKKLNKIEYIKFSIPENAVIEKKWRVGPLPLVQGFIFGFFLILFIEILKKSFK